MSEAAQKSNLATNMKQYLSKLYNFNSALVSKTLGLMLVTALLEGIGLMLLIPLLTLLGIGDTAGTNPAYFNWLSGLPLQLNLTTVLLIFLSVVIVQSFVIRARGLTTTKLRLQFVDHLRLQLFTAMTRANWNFFIQRKSAEFTHTLTADLSRIGTGTYSLLQFGIAVFLAGIYVVIATQLSWPMTLLALFCGLALWLILRKQNINAILSGKALTSASETLHHGLHEYLNSLKIAKSHNAEAQHLQLFTSTLSDLQERQLQFSRSLATTGVSYRIGAALSLCLLVYVAIQYFSLSADRLLVMTLVFARLMPMLANLQQQYQQILHMMPAFTSYNNLLEQVVANQEPDEPETSTLVDFSKAIQIDNISYSYQPEQRVINKLSCVIPAQKTIALIGPSGSGKTTLADILTGLLWPQEGRIHIHTTDLSPTTRHAWQAQIAYVPQETVLFNDSLRNNLRWLQPKASDEELWQALEKTSANFVRDLPQGLDTIVGERGIRLSGGERQRIALARALLRKPRLLILDEATSALDTQHERAIQETLERLHGDLTILLIAHRLSTVRNADLIIVMEHGKLIQQGSWAKLMQEKEGLFYALHVADQRTRELGPL